MRRIWTAVGLSVFVAGCGIISGLDGLGVPDASTDDDASCATCNDAAANLDVVPPIDVASDSGDAGPFTGPSAAVACGQDVCKGQTPNCCRTPGGTSTYSYKCITTNQTCSGLVIQCDSQDDCTSGEVCCFSGYVDGGCVVASNVSCTEPNKCVGVTDGILCGDASQCAATQPCSPSVCSLPGYDVCK